MFKQHTYITGEFKESAKTDIIHGVDNVINALMQLISSAHCKIDSCVDYTRPYLTIEIEKLKNALLDAKTRGVKIRYLTEITKDNLGYCKQIMPLVDELRHLNGIKGNFYLSEKEYAAPATFHKKETSADMMIHSSVKEIIVHQQYVFDSIWNTSTSAERKIREIERDVSYGITEIIDHPSNAQELFINLIKSAKSEILLILPTVNAFIRKYRIGAIQNLKEVSTDTQRRIASSTNTSSTKENLKKEGGHKGVNVRLLTPHNKTINKILDELNIKPPPEKGIGFPSLSGKSNSSLFQIRHLESISMHNVTTVTILVVDRKASLVLEKVDDSKENFAEAIGLSTYSTSEPTIMSYVSIFENFWGQIELYEKVKEHEKMQKEFINIASHELKTPTQSILAFSTLIRRHPERRDEMLDAIERNAARLQSLTNNILDVSRIDSQTLRLNKEKFNINEKIRDVVNDLNTRHGAEITFADPKVDPIVVEADKIRIYEVISNLLTNAIKIVQNNGGSSVSNSNRGSGGGLREATITVSAVINSNPLYKRGSNNVGEEDVTISIMDRGTGIDPDIKDKLFSKFFTKSETGTGLGLYICKGIVESHGGRIWAENNKDGKGATFSFSLPLNKKQQRLVYLPNKQDGHTHDE
jgi:two-component system sensor histidine kinase VicK